jgi:hypothetical protein
MALIALDRFEEALDHCDRCLSFDKNNRSVQVLRERASKAQTEKARKETERLQSIQREQNSQRQLNTAFRVSVIFTLMRHSPT